MPKPTSFVAAGLDAYLAVSRDERANLLADSELASRREGRAIASQGNQRAENRSVSNDRDQMQRLAQFMEEKAYEREVIRPLELQAAHLQNERRRFDLENATNQARTDQGIINDYQGESQFLRGILSGEISMDAPVDELEDSTTYWDDATSQPVVAMKKGEKMILLGSDRKVKKAELSSLRKIRTYGAGDDPIYDVKAVLSEAKLKGNPDARRASDAWHLYSDMVERVAANPRNKELVGSAVKVLGENLQRNPHVRFLQSQGEIDPPMIREMKQKQARATVEAGLRLEMGDERAEAFLQENPRTVADMGNMSPDQQRAQAGRIAERILKEEKDGVGAGSGITSKADRTGMRKLEREIRTQKTLLNGKLLELEDARDGRGGKDSFGKKRDLEDDVSSIRETIKEKEASLNSYLEGEVIDGGRGTRVTLPSHGAEVDVADYLKG